MIWAIDKLEKPPDTIEMNFEMIYMISEINRLT